MTNCPVCGQPIPMKCPRCGYIWRNAVENPKKCPKCQKRLDMPEIIQKIASGELPYPRPCSQEAVDVMEKISRGEIKEGDTFEVDGKTWKLVEYVASDGKVPPGWEEIKAKKTREAQP